MDVDRLTWTDRIGFGAGDFAQNLVYAAVGSYLLFFYTDVIDLPPAIAASVFFVVQIVDTACEPFVGVFIDRVNPPWGKYRSYLLLAGLPLVLSAVLCFTHLPVEGVFVWKILYAYAAYAGFSLLFAVVNVAYGALNASLSRETDEITLLTTVRIFMANTGCLAAMVGIPLFVASFASERVLPWRMMLFMGFGMLPSFVFMPFLPALRRFFGKRNLFFVFASVAVAGMAALYVLSRLWRVADHPGLIYAAQFVKASGIIVATGYMWTFVPEVIAYSEHRTGRRMSGIVNAVMGCFCRLGMAFGKVLSGGVLAWTGYRAAVAEGKISLPTEPRAWFWTMVGLATLAAALLVFSFTRIRERVVMDAAESALVKVGDLWREFFRNAPLRLLSLFFVVVFAMFSVGNAAGVYFMNGLEEQPPSAGEGIRWLVCIIPSLLLAVAAAVIARYPLSDDLVARLNREISGKSAARALHGNENEDTF